MHDTLQTVYQSTNNLTQHTYVHRANGLTGEMDYSDPNHPEHGVTDGLDMDMVHDFGEGVGLDMRDFTSHDVDDGLGQGDQGMFNLSYPESGRITD